MFMSFFRFLIAACSLKSGPEPTFVIVRSFNYTSVTFNHEYRFGVLRHLALSSKVFKLLGWPLMVCT